MRIFFLSAVLFFAFLPAQSQTKNFIDQPYIEVNGYADTLLTPDEIYIKIIISEKDTKDRLSVEELEIRMVDSLKSIGIDVEKDLTANDMSSNFKFYLLKSKDVLKSKQYVLKVRDAVTASKVFTKLEEAEISNTSIDHVDYSDVNGIENIMRTKAVENARTGAVALTSPLNQNIGLAIHIADNQSKNVDLQGRLEEVVVMGYGGFKKHREEPQPAKIDSKKIKVSTNINVKFILK